MKDRILELKRLHGYIHDINTEKKDQAAVNKLIRKGMKRSRQLDEQSLEEHEDYPIDFVVPWVDGNDPIWRAEKDKYLGVENNVNNTAARYRNWDIFKYWFRMVEENAPWVNCVYLLTYGHVPSWLNIECPKLRVINHKDFIPQQYLPTFSSHTIEWNMFRIPDLSEHFIYFNDDVFITSPVKKTDFFQNGLPKYCSLAKPVSAFKYMKAYNHALINNLGIINSDYDLRSSMEKYPEKWFSYKYEYMHKDNRQAYMTGYLSGMYFSHLGVPYRKSTFENFVEKNSDIVNDTCSHRFRTSDDIMHQVIQMVEMVTGQYVPVEQNYYGYMLSINQNALERVKNTIVNKTEKMVCLNDSDSISDEEYQIVKRKLRELLSDRYPNKSMFESK